MHTARDLFSDRKFCKKRFGPAPFPPMLRAALRRIGRADLIGNSKRLLIPAYQPATHRDVQVPREPGQREQLGAGLAPEGARKVGRIKTQHTGLRHIAPLKKANRPPRNFHPGSPTGAGKRR